MKKVFLFSFVAFWAIGAFSDADAQTLKWVELYRSDLDSLVSTVNDTISVSLLKQGRSYPKFVGVVYNNKVNINNGERVTMNVRQGYRSIYETEATLDTLVTAATADLGAVRFIDTQAVTGVGTKLRFTFGQLASAAATDSISYAVAIFGIYQSVIP